MFRTLALAALLLLAQPAHATWSIILIDTRTGEVALGSATCLTNFDLKAGTPVLITGVGGATAQSFVDSTGQNRVLIRDHLILQTDPADILSLLAAFDPGHQTRQYGIADTLGRAATFSGPGAGAWAGGQTGQFENLHLGKSGTVVYAIQGNVLTGEPVVAAAVQAAINSPGDLPHKLMLSMEAARSMGGDGRCSCSPGNPTGCGSPPPNFTKSAHIAYMLIARAGDRDGANGIYRVGSAPFDLIIHDFDADGRPDIASANNSSSNLSILPNITPQSSPFAIMAPAISAPAGAGARALAAADITGDGHIDLISANFSASNISILPGSGSLSFPEQKTYSVGPGPQALAVAPLDNDNSPDIAVALNTAGAVAILINNGGAFGLPSFLSLQGAYDIAAADLDNDGSTDLAVLSRTLNKVAIFRGDGNGEFTLHAELPVGSLPSALIAADLDGDGSADLAVAEQSGNAVKVFLNNGDGSFKAPANYPLPFNAVDLGAADLDGDGVTDLAVACGTSAGFGRFVILKGLGDGAFQLAGQFAAFGNLTDIAIADLNGDGLPDLAFTGGGSILIVQNLGDGLFNSGVGCATGEYFMSFNLPFQLSTNPDPVFQLQDMFDEWRADLLGRPDAVQSDAVLNPPAIPADGQSTSTLLITPRDWQGDSAAILSITVEHAPAGAGQSTIGPVKDLGNGSYSVLLTAGSAPGEDRFIITIDDGIRPVILMPEPTLTLTSTCYPDCDNNGSLNIDDFLCFQLGFALQDPYADCDGNSQFNIDDFLCFQLAFALGC